MRPNAIAGVVVMALALCAQADLAVASDGGDGVTVRRVPAKSTDPAIDRPGIGDHYVALGPAGARTGRLVVFFPGTRARPDQYSALLRRSAELGYHTIGLAYINDMSVNFDLCKATSPPDCHEDVRREVLTGSDTSELVDVSPANSAFNRIVKLLSYLHLQHPGEGWDTFVSGGKPRWGVMTTMGQSQGGGHAAFTAKLHKIERAVLFSATEPAAWTLDASATPAQRYFGLVHRLEPIYQPIVRSWSNLEMRGPQVIVEIEDAPYGGSHRLETVRIDCTGDPTNLGFAHNCASVDGWMPPSDADGKPAFQAVWDYLLTQDPEGRE